jgi:RNA polymerase sigma factor (TIGR02999 family)
MRRVLLMHARKRRAAKRGGGQRPLPLHDVTVGTEEHPVEVIALNDALAQLEALDERLVRVVECRYFGGLTIPETAEALGISPATVKRDWRTAKAWLYQTLRSSSSSDQ